MAFHIIPSTQPSLSTSDSPLRIALFDLDGTLTTSKKGKRWAMDADDWIFQGDVPAVFQRCSSEGWRVAIVTNQSGWAKGMTAHNKIKSVLDALLSVNGWAPSCFVATGPVDEAIYRKPGRGLYDLFLKELGVSVSDVAELIMCGDAAGSDASCPEYRWANTDAEFARSIGADFKTPEMIFGRASAVPYSKQEIVILVGNMGSGKSTSAKALESSGYTHFEQDVLKTAAAVQRAANKALTNKKSVVIDASHSTAEHRAPYIVMAKARGIDCRILWHIRDGRPYNALRPHPVPEVAYAVYSKRFQDPRLDGVPVSLIY